MFSQNLKNLRIKNKMTQEQLANELNIARSTINNYEQGASEPNIENLKKLAQIFHVTLENLLGYEIAYLIDKSQYSDYQLDTIEKIVTLTKEQCAKVDAYIDGLKN